VSTVLRYVEAVRNRSSPPAILLREVVVDGSRIRKRTRINLSFWPLRGRVLGKLARSIGLPCFCGVVLPFGAIDHLTAAEFWLSGVDPVVQRDRHVDNPADYMQLFQPDAPWATAAAGLQAFKISTQMSLRGTDDELKTIIDGLKARHIGLAIEIGLLAYSDRCGRGTEGYGAPLAVEAAAKRIVKMGGQLDYVAMDEPVTWGHEKVGRNAQGYEWCHDSVSELVDQAAPKIALLQRYFPNIQIGEIDAVNPRCCPSLAGDILEFTDQLKQTLHLKLAFVHADVAWDTNWRPMLQQLAQGLRTRGIPLGVVCDGDATLPSDEASNSQALARCTEVTRDPKTKPDVYVVQTWLPRPTRMLPENQPGTLTNLLKQAEAAFR
jgi:hypothetical protein